MTPVGVQTVSVRDLLPESSSLYDHCDAAVEAVSLHRLGSAYGEPGL